MTKCRRVSGVGKCMKKTSAFFRGEIELAGGIICDVGCNDTRYLLTERLNGDCPSCLENQLRRKIKLLTWLPFQISSFEGTSSGVHE